MAQTMKAFLLLWFLLNQKICAAKTVGDLEDSLDYPNSEFGSGSSPWIDEEQSPNEIHPHPGSDDEDYSYVEEHLQPSSPRIPDLPSPTPAFQLDSEASVFANMFLSTPALPPISSDAFPAASVSYTPLLPAATIQNLASAPSLSSFPPNEWLHVGSGDSIDVDPTPSVEGGLQVSSTTGVAMTTNMPPMVSKPISKILIHGGHFIKQPIDSHFHDDKDLSLKLTVRTNEEWVYTLGNDLVMLPTVEDVSDYRFNLTAEDSGGLKTSTDLIISVRQPSRSRQWYFYYQFSFPVFFNWREIIYRNMTHRSHGHGSFIVNKVTVDGNRINLQYVNETLMDFDGCPLEKIQSVAEYYKQFYPDFHYILLPGKMCENFRVVNASKTNNYPPSIKNQIDFINCSMGELFVYKVPDDFCYDPEEGSTGNLQLALVDFNQEPLKPDNWLQFDAKNQEFYGIFVSESPQSDVFPVSVSDKTPGGVSGGKYVLTCSDSLGKGQGNAGTKTSLSGIVTIPLLLMSGGTPSEDALKFDRGHFMVPGKKAVDVLDTWISIPDEQFNAEFSLHFTSNTFGPFQIRKFMEKLGSLFNSTPNQIKIKSYTLDNHVVHFTWYNKSNPGEKEITQLRKVLFSNEGPVDKKVIELFSPEFNITGGNIVPIGRLVGEDTVFHFQTNSPSAPGSPATGTEEREGDIDEEVSVYSNYSNYLVTYIIPSVLIAVMVLLSLIIACLLSRKKKMPGEGNEIRKVGGGVPVIFQDELEAEHPLLQSAGASSTPLKPSAAAGGPSRAAPQPPPLHRAASSTPPPIKCPHPPGYKSVAKYEPPMPPVQYSGSSNKNHHNSNAGILPPPYVPP